MYLEDLKEGELGSGEELLSADGCSNDIAVSDAKRALVGAGARALFYPTLLYNVVRNKVQSEFRWWDRVDEFILLGAVPFPSDVPRLKELGVGGVITLNEPYETLVPTSLYHTHSIDHLVIPTRDYLFAPSFGDICQAVDFIQKNASCGKTTYVHCKAGRGRSTTIVLCYLVQHKQMTPDAAFEWVRSIRRRVLLAPSQWHAVQEYYRLSVQKTRNHNCTDIPVAKTLGFPANLDFADFEDRSTAVVTESDLRVKKTGNLSRLDIPVVNTLGFPANLDFAAFDDRSTVVVTESDFRVKKTGNFSRLDIPVVKTFGFPANLDFAAFEDRSTEVVTESDFRVKKTGNLSRLDSPVVKTPGFQATRDLLAFDDGSIVLVTESDLDGYEGSRDSDAVGNAEILEEQSLGHRVQFASQTALARLSCMWLRSHARQKISSDKMGRENSCSEGTDQLGGLGVDIHVY